MDWILVGLVLAFIAVFFFFNRGGLVDEKDARAWLRDGARVIDVRTDGEYQQYSIPGALNVPLGQLKTEMPRHVRDKYHVLLLHCAAGGRSAIGCRMLKQVGYTKVFNLGSYNRAARIVAGAEQPKSSEDTRT